MLRVLKNIFKDKQAPTERSLTRELQADSVMVPRYPPFVEGLPAVTVDQILATQEKLLGRIDLAIKLPPAELNRLVYPAIRSFAAYVHLLPASQDWHHKGVGGLLHHSLEVGLFALIKAGASAEPTFKGVDAAENPGLYKQLQRRWEVAVFLAGLYHDVGKPQSDLRVRSRDGELEWDGTELSAWLIHNKMDRYFLTWNAGRNNKHHFFGPVTASRLLPDVTRQWLGEHGNEILNDLFETIGEARDDVSEMRKIVTAADSASAGRDTNRIIASEGSTGVPVVTYVMDAMRRLITDGTWTINEKGSRVWVVDDGVYIVWPQGTNDIVKLLNKDKKEGIPRHPYSLAECLIDAKIAAHYTPEDGKTHIYWPVAPDVIQNEGKNIISLKCIKITDKGRLFEDADAYPDPVSYILEHKPRSDDKPEKGKSAPGVKGVPAKAKAAAKESQPFLPSTPSKAQQAELDLEAPIQSIGDADKVAAETAKKDETAERKNPTEAPAAPMPAFAFDPGPDQKNPKTPAAKSVERKKAEAAPEASGQAVDEAAKPTVAENPISATPKTTKAAGAVSAGVPDFAFDISAFSAPSKIDDKQEPSSQEPESPSGSTKTEPVPADSGKPSFENPFASLKAEMKAVSSTTAEADDTNASQQPKSKKRREKKKPVTRPVIEATPTVGALQKLGELVGEQGGALIEIAKAMQSGAIRWGDVLHQTAEGVLVGYPAAVEPYGDPTALLRALTDKKLIEPDPASPTRKVRKVGSKSGLVLAKEVGDLLLSVAGSVLSLTPEATEKKDKPKERKAAPAKPDSSKKPKEQGDAPAATEPAPAATPSPAPTRSVAPTQSVTSAEGEPSDNPTQNLVSDFITFIRTADPDEVGIALKRKGDRLETTVQALRAFVVSNDLEERVSVAELRNQLNESDQVQLVGSYTVRVPVQE